MLSILLPSYNNKCLSLVKTLQQQASGIDGLEYEIIVADDGGNDNDIKAFNDGINRLPNCRYIKRNYNVGRAVIRNYLASQAKGDWLLFLDSDVAIVQEDFLLRYISAMTDTPTVIDGGVTIIGDPKELRSNLRFWYEYKSAPQHTADKRNLHPYQSIHTANLLVPRAVMQKNGFDERFVRYGYEDVLFGKNLKSNGISVKHIDAPVGLDKFERNLTFVNKTQEALETLHFFRKELEGYSSLLTMIGRMERLKVKWMMRLFHKVFYPMEKINLISSRPSILIFKIYKLGYFATLK